MVPENFPLFCTTLVLEEENLFCEKVLNPLWKSAKRLIHRWKISEGNDSRLPGPNQFVCHTAPANLACDERVSKIQEVQERDENC